MTPRTAVLAACAEILGEPVTDASKAFSDLGADSLDVLDITMSVEEDLEIALADKDIGPETTVAEFIEIVERAYDELTSAEIKA